MPVIEQVERETSSDPEYLFYCPGCRLYHWFKTTGTGPTWTWNYDYEKPTVEPSINVNPYQYNKRCHLFIRDGQIEFLNDCHHSLAGQTVPMEQVI